MSKIVIHLNDDTPMVVAEMILRFCKEPMEERRTMAIMSAELRSAVENWEWELVP